MANMIMQLWKFTRGETPASTFEQWVYATSELEDLLNSERYLTLISTNYRDTDEVSNLQRTIWKWLEADHSSFIKATYGYRTEPRHCVRFFEAKCRMCGQEFGLPLLGDFAYGEFIFQSEGGDYFVYLQTIDNPVWDRIRDLIHQVEAQEGQQVSSSRDKLQWIVRRCIDPINGQRMMARLPICPHCQSISIVYSDAKPLYDRCIPTASFSGFLGLNESEQVVRIRALMVEWESFEAS